MPWQQQVADVGLELLPDGRPAYREVILTVPRQSGKTTLILAWEVQRALGWASLLDQPQRIMYSAQTGKDAREKLVQDQFPILHARKGLLGISDFKRANGSEAVEWRNGSRLGVLASTEDSGHGKTIDMAVKDELFADTDNRRDQALNPAMATRAYAQTLTASTMGTVDSVALNEAVEKGRLAIEEDLDRSVCYFEWSATKDDDPGDPDVWATCMPALGHTIPVEVVEHAYRTLPLGEFQRAYMNIMTENDERVIPYAAWNAICDPNAEVQPEVFAFDVNPIRSAAGIIAVGGGPVLEVVDYRAGTGWLVDRICELHAKYRRPFVCDRGSPAAPFVDELLRREVKLIELKPAEVVRASGAFYDAVVGGAFRVRQNYDLDTAVAGAAKRNTSGDSWTWGRNSSTVDICLLVAASLGLWVSMNPEPEAVPMVAFV